MIGTQKEAIKPKPKPRIKLPEWNPYPRTRTRPAPIIYGYPDTFGREYKVSTMTALSNDAVRDEPKPLKLDQIDLDIMEGVKRPKRWSEMEGVTNISTRTLSKHLKKLVEADLVERHNMTENGKTRYELTPKGWSVKKQTEVND